MDNKKITVSGFEELRKIIEEGNIPLQNIDIKNSNINSFWDYTQGKGLFEGIDFKTINGTIKDWDISKITDLSNTFKKTKNIPYDELSNWDTSNVTDLDRTFEYSDFNGDISKWNTGKVETIDSTFKDSEFNGDIFNWNVSKVVYMNKTFYKSKFNGDISNWDTSNVKYLGETFSYSEFNGDIYNWDVDSVIYAYRIFYNSSLDKKQQNLFLKNLNLKDIAF